MKMRLFCLGLVLSITGGFSARAEIVERDLGTDTEGKPVSGYVFQAGRSHRVSSLRRSSGLQSRRVVRSSSRSRGTLQRGYRSPYYWYVPVIPLHCGGIGYGGYFSIWHGTHAHSGVTVRVIR
jgi:hypothetical protein